MDEPAHPLGCRVAQQEPLWGRVARDAIRIVIKEINGSPETRANHVVRKNVAISCLAAKAGKAPLFGLLFAWLNSCEGLTFTSTYESHRESGR